MRSLHLEQKDKLEIGKLFHAIGKESAALVTQKLARNIRITDNLKKHLF
ncbi:MAG: hypothetical protein QM500_21240 [Methylococcales bacterium]